MTLTKTKWTLKLIQICRSRTEFTCTFTSINKYIIVKCLFFFLVVVVVAAPAAVMFTFRNVHVLVRNLSVWLYCWFCFFSFFILFSNFLISIKLNTNYLFDFDICKFTQWKIENGALVVGTFLFAGDTVTRSHGHTYSLACL